MSSLLATAKSVACASCGTEILSDVLFRQCPRCLLDLGLSCATEAETDNFFPQSLPWGSKEANFDYELLQRIGRGGMGIVYRARQRSLNRIVALKMIATGDFATPSALARFRREAETAAKLDHSNIVAIIEIGEHQANPYLVMRLVEGDSLAGRFQEFALPPQAKAAEAGGAQARIAHLLAIVARAVDYAHRRGVLHRDLKPSNILLDQEDNPHLTDFGIAKSLDQDPGLTQTAELLGTISYMAPEQAAGKPLSRAADIYSLGAILYELLTNHRPFEGPKMEVLRQVIENEPPPPRLINSAIDRDLATICLKCLDKNPARRYPSALELAEDLERWQRHEPVLARKAGPMVRLQRWSVRNPAVATLIVSLTIGIAVSLALLSRANEEKSRKSIALDILRTESARQLQEIWNSSSSFFAIKSETLSAMAGMEVPRLNDGEQRYTMALVPEGNPLDRVLRAAPMFDQLEHSIGGPGKTPARLDLRIYKDSARSIQDLVKGEIDFAQLNAREFLRARDLDPKIQPLIAILPNPGFNDAAVIFTRKNTGIKSLSDLRGKSFLLSSTHSTMSFWTKVALVDSGIRARDFSKYRYITQTNDLFPDGKSMPAVAVGNPFSPMTPVEAVIAGVYDAGVVGEKRFREVAAEHQLIELHRFHENGDLIVARGHLPSDATQQFQRALVDLKSTQYDQIFHAAPARFKITTENDFKEMSRRLEAETEFLR